MGLLRTLQDAPCVDTMHGSGGCILTFALLRLIWDPGITATNSLVIARGCFQEVSRDGTVQCSILSRGCYRSSRIVWDPRIIPRSVGSVCLIVELYWHCLRTSNLWRGRTVMFRY